MWAHGEFDSPTASLLAQTISDRMNERGQLAASFFFSKHTTPSTFESSTIPGRASIIPTIAYQLAQTITEMQGPIARAIMQDISIFDLSLETQIRKLIVEPLEEASMEVVEEYSHQQSHGATAAFSPIPKVIVIQGLDKCEDESFEVAFLRALCDVMSLPSVCYNVVIPLRLLVVGRCKDGHKKWIDSLPVHRAPIVLKRPVEDPFPLRNGLIYTLRVGGFIIGMAPLVLI